MKSLALNARVRGVVGLLLIGLTCLAQPPEIWTIIPRVVAVVNLNEGSTPTLAYELARLVGIFALAVAAPMLAAFCSPRWKWFLFLLFFSSLVTNAVFHRVSGHSMAYVDWVILWQAKANIGDAVSEYFRPLVKATIGVTPLLAGFMLVPVVQRRIWPWAAGATLLSIGVFVAQCVTTQGGDTGLFPRSTSLHGKLVSTAFDRPMARYTYATDRQPDAKPIADHIVLVIDESVSHDYFSRVVLPRIRASNSAWRVHDFGLATSMSNCSMATNVMLRKLAGADSVALDLYRNPLVWSLARNAGLATWLLDAQLGGFGHNLFDDVERSLIDHRPWVRTGHDANLVDRLRAAWSGAPSFTLVIKQGAHFPYEKKYPARYASDSPVLSAPYVRGSERRTHYVNAVDYQTGDFFRRLSEVVPAARTIVLYTSDHGQNIEDSPGLTHCNSSVGVQAIEGIVPLLILANFDVGGLAEAATRNRDRMSQFDMVETLRGFLGYGSQSMASSGLFRASGDPVPGFVYGSPFGFFGRPVQMLPVDRPAYRRQENERWSNSP